MKKRYPMTTETKPGTDTIDKESLKSIPIEELMTKLKSSPEGLTQAEAEKRLAMNGPNEIVNKKTNPILKFLGLFLGAYPLATGNSHGAIPRFTS